MNDDKLPIKKYIVIAGNIFNKTKNILSGVSVKIEGIKQNENE